MNSKFFCAHAIEESKRSYVVVMRAWPLCSCLSEVKEKLFTEKLKIHFVTILPITTICEQEIPTILRS